MGGVTWSPDIRLVRRLILLWSLAFWQGGFMFYGGVVVPVGSRILGSDQEQARVTRSVTNYLNGAGAVALAAWGWDVLAEGGASPRGRRLRGCCWSLLVLALVLLTWFHARLDDLLDPEGFVILDRRRFHSLHRQYLALSTAQWGGSLALSVLTIRAWRDGDAVRSGRAKAP